MKNKKVNKKINTIRKEKKNLPIKLPIKFTKEQIKIFEKFGVETIYLYGSYAQGFTHPMSDVDIGVVLKNPAKYENKTMEPYMKLWDIFTDIFPNIKKVDVVLLQFTPIGLQRDAVIDGKVLYEKSLEKKFIYKENVLKRFADIKYFYDMRHKAILDRI